MAGIDLTDVSLINAYEAVRSAAAPTTWALFGYPDAKSNKLVSLGTGSGGLNELATLCDAGIVAYGYIRVHLRSPSDTADTTLPSEYILMTWLGSGVVGQRKSRASTHKKELKKKLLRDIVLEVTCRIPEHVSEVAITSLLVHSKDSKVKKDTQVIFENPAGGAPAAPLPPSKNRTASVVAKRRSSNKGDPTKRRSSDKRRSKDGAPPVPSRPSLDGAPAAPSRPEPVEAEPAEFDPQDLTAPIADDDDEAELAEVEDAFVRDPLQKLLPNAAKFPNDNRLVPDPVVGLVSRLLPNIKTEGLFRVSGSKDEVDALTQAVLDEEMMDMSTILAQGPAKPFTREGAAPIDPGDVTDPHTLASAIKLYFRQRNPPLLSAILPSFKEAFAPLEPATAENEQDRLYAFQDVLLPMPAPERRTFGFLCSFFLHALKHQDVTRMNLPNLCTVFAPNMISKQAMMTGEIGHAYRFIIMGVKYAWAQSWPDKPFPYAV